MNEFILNFDKNNYPLDHLWRHFYFSHDESFKYEIITYYHIRCINCGLCIKHCEFKTASKVHSYLIYTKDNAKFKSMIDNDILSCAEMTIKKLLE